MVTELPFNVGPERVIERIKSLVQTKKLQGIADLVDLTDGEHGLRLELAVKTGFHADAVLDQLYRLTPLEEQFSINSVALVDGQPRLMGLKGLLEVFLDHRLDGRAAPLRVPPHPGGRAAAPGGGTAHRDRRHRRGDRGHPGQRRRERGPGAADARLRPLAGPGELHPGHAAAPAHQVQPSSSWNRSATSCAATIADLDDILTHDARLRSVVSAELAEVAAQHGTPRRTILLEGDAPLPRRHRPPGGQRLPLLGPAEQLRPAGPHQHRRAARGVRSARLPRRAARGGARHGAGPDRPGDQRRGWCGGCRSSNCRRSCPRPTARRCPAGPRSAR